MRVAVRLFYYTTTLSGRDVHFNDSCSEEATSWGIWFLFNVFSMKQPDAALGGWHGRRGADSHRSDFAGWMELDQ